MCGQVEGEWERVEGEGRLVVGGAVQLFVRGMGHRGGVSVIGEWGVEGRVREQVGWGRGEGNCCW